MQMKELENTLEQLIDKHGLGAISEALSQVCYEKADHIRSNWQDNGLAKRWETAAMQFPSPAFLKDIHPSLIR